jgi:hypothetical protein
MWFDESPIQISVLSQKVEQDVATKEHSHTHIQYTNPLLIRLVKAGEEGARRSAVQDNEKHHSVPVRQEFAFRVQKHSFRTRLFDNNRILHFCAALSEALLLI